jgi:formylglycine-generating enzyme required for sulfatase activity
MKNSKQNMMKMLPALAVSLLMAGMFAGCGGADVAKESVPASTVSASAKAEANESNASDVQKGAPMEKLQTTTYEVNGVRFKMILVEGGTFRMGSDDRNVEFSESPAHNVTLTKDYLIGETEVTQALWNAVTGRSTSKSTLPQTSVTWEDAHAFVDRLNEIAHAQGIIAPSQSFCLPTEAQWEYAAKGGNKSKGYRYWTAHAKAARSTARPWRNTRRASSWSPSKAAVSPIFRRARKASCARGSRTGAPPRGRSGTSRASLAS